MALEMTAQISTQFVPIVLRSPKICALSLLSLLMKQVWEPEEHWWFISAALPKGGGGSEMTAQIST